MALKDTKAHYKSINDAVPAEVKVLNTVSGALKTGDRALAGVIAESGKAYVDSEVNLSHDALRMQNALLRRWHTQSGWLRGTTHFDAYCDYKLGVVPGVVDSTGTHKDVGTDTLLDAIVLPRIEALVAGNPVVVEYSNTTTDLSNLIALQPPDIYDGTPNTVKRTDFVFLEVWKALVAPSVKASGTVQVVNNAQLLADAIANHPNKVTINGTDLLVVKPADPLVGNDFHVDAVNANNTALNMAAAINDPGNAFAATVTAVASGDTVIIKAKLPGSAGNAITLSVTVWTPGTLLASGAVLAGGANRPNKPSADQSKIYRHGNVDSPSATWLPDELTDPVLDEETSQRVQIQYRIRATGATEAVDYKLHPDGFSSLNGGNPALLARGGRSTPQANYPFVPADGSNIPWQNSDASAYGYIDDGLWIAGDGSDAAAAALGSLDGFVYAIPLCFVFRHNNCSDIAVATKGFDPVNNTNGAPTFGHAQYNGVLGVIFAGDSDRPDKAFCNVINDNNILDLRRHVIPSGIDLKAELTYQMQSLLDGSLRTWAMDTTSKETLGNGSGDVSTHFLVCNEIGRSTAVGGAGPTSGDSTNRGNLIRNFDHIARRFGAQPVVERVVFAFWPGDRPGNVQGGPVAPGLINAGKYVVKVEDPLNPGVPKDADGWYEGDVLHLDLNALNATTLGGIFQGLSGGGGSTGLGSENFVTFAPVGTIITDVLRVTHDDGHYAAAIDQNVQINYVKGLGTRHVELGLDANGRLGNGGVGANPNHKLVGSDVAGAITPSETHRRIFVEFEVTYPIGVGLTDTFQYEQVPEVAIYTTLGTGASGPGPAIATSTSQRPNDMEQPIKPRFRQGYREVNLEYAANDTVAHGGGNQHLHVPIGTNAPFESVVSLNRTQVLFPRRVFGGRSGIQITDNVDGLIRQIDSGNTEFGCSSRKVVINPAGPNGQLSGAGQTLCDILYFAQDPIPNYGAAGYQVGVYFRTNTPQTAGVKEGDIGSSAGGTLPTTLKVEPLAFGSDVWTGQRGVGSHDLGFPYAAPLDQIPIKDGDALNPQTFVAGLTREWFFCATTRTTVADFEAETGLLALHPYVQGDSQNILTLGGAPDDQKPVKDAEWRAYYPFADDQTYRPTIMAEPLFGAVRHKVMVPLLARATEDVPGVAGGLLFRKNELLLIVICRFAKLDDDNTVRFSDPTADDRTCAAVYRTRNMLMLVGDRVCS